MKQKILFVLAMTLSFYPAVSASSQITLADCQKNARENYPLVKQYDLIALSKNYTIESIKKNYLPQVKIFGNISYQNDATSIPFQIPGVEGRKGQPKDQYRIVLDIEQNIWDGGVNSYKKSTAALQHLEKEEKVNVSLYALKDRVIDVFFGALLMEEKLKLNKLLQERLDLNLKNIETYMQNGLANNTDIDIMKAEILNANQTAITLSGERESFLKMLSLLTGKEITNTDSLIRPILHLRENDKEEIKRPELRLFKVQEMLAQNDNKKLHSMYMPKIKLFAQAGYGNPGLNMLQDKFEPYYIIGAKFSWNLNSLYTIKEERLKIANKISLINTNKDLFLFNTHLMIEKQNIKNDYLLQQMKEDDKIISLRENISRAAGAKVANGTYSVSDMLKDISAEYSAKQIKMVHEIEYLMYQYKLDYLINNNNL